MYEDLIKFPIKHENLKWESSKTLLDIKEIPHFFLMIKLTGTKFPIRAQMTQVWVGDVYAQIVLIDKNGLTVRAYFDNLPGEGYTIYFGHLGNAELEFRKFALSDVARLNRSWPP